MNLSGSPVNYFAAFLGGILVSLTPCVYPLIPITAGYIGANSAGSKLKGLVLSLIYVTGIAITYSLLGLLASLTGVIFGKISAHPITYFFVGGMIILFALSMLDFFTMPFPNSIRKLSADKKQNYFSTFFLGLSSGLIVSPCLTPALSSILLYLATKKNLLYGITLLLSFAYGMGLILILVGTFSAALLNFPKLGKGMVYAKKFSALILIGMGIYFIILGLRRI